MMHIVVLIYHVIYVCSEEPSRHDLLLTVLWELVMHSSAQVRATSAKMFEVF